MSESTEQAVAADIEAAVRALPGVTGVFRSGGLLAKLVDAGAEALGTAEQRAPFVRWETGETGPRADVAIGVRASAGAAETSARAHEVATVICREHGIAGADIRVTVVHIDEDAERATDPAPSADS